MANLASLVAFAVPLGGVTSSDLFHDPIMGDWCVPYKFVELLSARATASENFYYGLGQNQQTHDYIRGVAPIRVPYSELTDQRRYGSGVSDLFRVISMSRGASPSFSSQHQVRHVSLIGNYCPPGKAIYEEGDFQVYPDLPIRMLNQYSGFPNLRTYGRPDPHSANLAWMGHSRSPMEFTDGVLTLAKSVPSEDDPHSAAYRSSPSFWRTDGDLLAGHGFLNVKAEGPLSLSWWDVRVNVYANSIRIARTYLSFSYSLLPFTSGGSPTLGAQARITAHLTNEADYYYLVGGTKYHNTAYQRSVTWDAQTYPLTVPYVIPEEDELKLYKLLLKEEQRLKAYSWHLRPTVQKAVSRAYQKATRDIGSLVETIAELDEVFELVPIDSILSAAELATSRVSRRTKDKELRSVVQRLKRTLHRMKEYPYSALGASVALMLLDLAAVVADLHLLYSFGIRPALEIPEQLESLLNRAVTAFRNIESTRIRVSRKDQIPSDFRQLGIIDGLVFTSYGVTIGGFADQSTSNLSNAVGTGLLPTPSRVWACVRWSWLIDYFLHVTERMEVAESYFFLHTLDPRDHVMSWRFYVDATELLSKCNLQPLFPQGVKLEYYNREKSVYVPYTFNYPLYGHLYGPSPDWKILASLIVEGINQFVHASI